MHRNADRIGRISHLTMQTSTVTAAAARLYHCLAAGLELRRSDEDMRFVMRFVVRFVA
jgi:hypothetical protein